MDGRAVDEHERRSAPSVLVQIAVILAGRDDDETVHSPLPKGSDERAFAIGVLVAAAREDEDSSVARRILDRPVEGRRERVRNVLEHEADRLRLAAEPPEHRRIRVPAVVQLLDRPPHPGLELGTHSPLVVDDAGHRLQPDARERSDVHHRRAALRLDQVL